MTNDPNANRVTGEPRDAHARCAIAANAAKVLETTRRAWSDAPAAPSQASAERRPPRAAQQKRVVPRRSRWASVVAAFNEWSPKPL
ncbi:hypothetical protein P9239_09330 [Caballeronia sp. LZ062]|uniref:hypothetical protein n=1 Tax=unclassified Caballeronia TaxID=2646786 RepID=UPI0028592A9F|nr:MULTISPECIES: hypothetical protein [unclassified Caballeronia]MDR5854916.1 hypothetical protein [Caballeronia sp. LZ050]MDR5870555.1 hypothetical protein [Caballeronia sp. LZ062]